MSGLVHYGGLRRRARHFLLRAERTPEIAGRNGKWYSLVQEKELLSEKGIITYQPDDIPDPLVQDVEPGRARYRRVLL